VEAAVRGKRPLVKWPLQGAAVEEALEEALEEATLLRIAEVLAVRRALLELMVRQGLAMAPLVGEAVLAVAAAVCLYLAKLLTFMVVAVAGVYFRALAARVAPAQHQPGAGMLAALPTLPVLLLLMI
jgi:hypothetical protein